MRPPALLILLAAFACGQAPDERQLRVEKACAGMSGHIEAFLGPRFKGPVPVKIVDVEFIGRFARDLEEKLVPDGLVETAERLAVRLHQVPPGYDIQAKQIEMVKRVVAGLYDPQANRFYLVEGRAGPGSPGFDRTLAHELVHAYRDLDHDYFGGTLAAVLVDTDWAIAMSCLTEGDATFLAGGLAATFSMRGDPGPFLEMLARRADKLAGTGMPAPPELKDYPVALREMIMGRYMVGLAFAASIYGKGGKQALEAAFLRPPRSTEQVLHPAKYLDQVDEPTIFSGGDPTAALGDGWKLELASTMGEFELRVHFLELLGHERAVKAAAGWDGARYFFASKKGAPEFFGAVTTWDTDEDAVEFARAWADWAAKRDGEVRPVLVGEGRFRGLLSVHTKEGLVRVRHAGRDVLVADGVPQDRAEEVFRALAAATRRERRADEKPGS